MTSPVIPCMRYRDAHAAIAWLGRVFDFEPQLVVSNDQGGVAHAQLSLTGARGIGMVMLGSAVDSDYGRLIRQPDQVGNAETQSAYLVIADTDGAHARAVEAGAEIVLPLRDQDYGGRGFTCRDLEGHVWSVGNYDPWA